MTEIGSEARRIFPFYKGSLLFFYPVSNVMNKFLDYSLDFSCMTIRKRSLKTKPYLVPSTIRYTCIDFIKY